MTDWLAILKQIAPTGRLSITRPIAAVLPDLFTKYEIDTPLRQAHFLSQCAHETDQFRTLNEYWGPTAAQKKYEGRADLGNTVKGDGKRFMGRGIIQITGRANYKRFSKRIGVDLVASPEKAADPVIACEIAGAYWADRGLNFKADRDDCRGCTRAINGGYNGLDERTRLLARAKKALHVDEATPVGLLTPTEPGPVPVTIVDPDPAPEPAKVYSEDEIRKVQCRLRELGYYEVGRADGKIGVSTRAAITAFREQEDLPDGKDIDEEFLAALVKAGPRPIAPARANATTEDVAAEVPEAKAALTTRIAAKAQAIGASGLAVVSGIGSQISDASDTLQPIKDFFSNIPTWLWFALVALVAAGIWWKARETTEATKEAYRKGARR